MRRHQKRRKKRAEVVVAQDAERADEVTARGRRRRQEADSSDGWDRFLISLPRRGAILMMQEKETGGASMGHLESTGARSSAIPGEDDSGRLQWAYSGLVVGLQWVDALD